MELERLISDYGYWAVLVGTMIEGEIVAVLGGYAAQSGYLHLPLVVLAAGTGSFLAHQAIFIAGRRYGPVLLARSPSWRGPVERALGLLHRHPDGFILGFRFLYGLRAMSALAIGMSQVSPTRFLALNAAAALLWAAVIGLLGYLFGHALEAVLGQAARFERYGFAVVLAAGTLAWLVVWVRRRRRPTPS